MAYSAAAQQTFDATTQALADLARIAERLTAQRDALRGGQSAHWGDAGTASHTAAAIREIADQMFGEGEYAHVACLRCGGSYANGGDPNDHRAHAAYEAVLAATR